LPIVSRDNAKRVLGIVTLADIVRYMRTRADARD
jgi:CBS domain-containing protein